MIQWLKISYSKINLYCIHHPGDKEYSLYVKKTQATLDEEMKQKDVTLRTINKRLKLRVGTITIIPVSE